MKAIISTVCQGLMVTAGALLVSLPSAAFAQEKMVVGLK